MKLWGLTGGIASGKSTVARLFAEEGAATLDADQIARELNAPGGAAHAAIQARFGTADREKLREIVFNDPGARAELEAILHPLIARESLARAKKLAEQAPEGEDRAIVIYEAALLVETGRYRDLDGLIVVSSPTGLRRERLIERDASDPELADKILASQISDEERERVADFVIENTSDINSLRAQVKTILAKIRSSS